MVPYVSFLFYRSIGMTGVETMMTTMVQLEAEINLELSHGGEVSNFESTFNSKVLSNMVLQIKVVVVAT